MIKILLVDDQQIDLELIKTYIQLAHPNYEILTESIAPKVYNLLQNFMPDLIVTDWEMPEMTGIELVQQIKSDRKFRTIPIIFCTGAKLNADDLKRAFDAGAVDYIHKPINRIELLARIKTHIDLKIGRDYILKQNVELKNQIRLRQKAEENLKEINKNLEEIIDQEIHKIQQQQQLLIQKSKLEALGSMAAGMAHEINQPLTGISMGLENILIKANLNKLTPEYLKNKINNLFEDIQRIKSIIEHVRIFSRDQSSANVEKINITDAVNNAINLIKAQYNNHNIKLDILLNDSDLYSLGNLYKLEQVVINMLKNAKDAVEEKQLHGNDILFEKQIHISAFCNKDHNFISIYDNGIGIKYENQKLIFDPFFTTKSAENGTGLGLSISYGIIREMNGEISVKSTENEFTEFLISLPKI